MKKYLSLFVATTLILIVGLSSSAFAKEVYSASISSQIHEAFGREILDIFEEASGIRVKSHIFSSKKAIERLRNGVTSIAASTIKLSVEDRKSGLIEIPICKDALVIITHPDCAVKNITIKQARKLFSGHIKNWKEIGGADQPVVKIIPDKHTGAYANFKRLAMGPFELTGDLVATKTFTAVIGVKNIPGAISFISNGIAAKYNDISVLNVDGVFPSDSEYPFHQFFSMVIKGKPTPVIKEIIKFLTCDAAVEIMKERGIQPVFK